MNETSNGFRVNIKHLVILIFCIYLSCTQSVNETEEQHRKIYRRYRLWLKGLNHRLGIRTSVVVFLLNVAVIIIDKHLSMLLPLFVNNL